MPEKIYQSVGNNGKNTSTDVRVVQLLLNKNINLLKPHLPLKVDGDCGPVTIGLIVEFQRRMMNMAKPDGKIDPGSPTFEKLIGTETTQGNRQNQLISGLNSLLLEVQQWLATFGVANNQDQSEPTAKTLSEGDYLNAANILGVNVPAVKAVARVESAGGGFLSNGKPKVLFEGHHFSKHTNGKYDKSHPSLSYKEFTRAFYSKDGIKEYARYENAKGLDSNAAMLSTSWGMFQIMGFNYKSAGYSSVEEFVTAMNVSEGKQLLAFVNFLKAEKLDAHLKKRDWAAFARGYNGPKYAVNKYDKKLMQAYEAYSAGGT